MATDFWGEFLHQAKPCEEQTLMNMFGWLDAEVKRLDQEPKAQKIFDEAKKGIHKAFSETKRECLGQMQDAALGAAQTQKKVEDPAYELSHWLRAQGDASDGRFSESTRSSSVGCGRPQTQPVC